MESDLERQRPHTFVLQVAANEAGSLTGLIQLVRTGEKRRFEGTEGLYAAIHDMARGDEAAKKAT